jgi:hypothetical protein
MPKRVSLKKIHSDNLLGVQSVDNSSSDGQHTTKSNTMMNTSDVKKEEPVEDFT